MASPGNLGCCSEPWNWLHGFINFGLTGVQEFVQVQGGRISVRRQQGTKFLTTCRLQKKIFTDYELRIIIVVRNA
jgi:hypothetical protein